MHSIRHQNCQFYVFLKSSLTSSLMTPLIEILISSHWTLLTAFELVSIPPIFSPLKFIAPTATGETYQKHKTNQATLPLTALQGCQETTGSSPQTIGRFAVTSPSQFFPYFPLDTLIRSNLWLKQGPFGEHMRELFILYRGNADSNCDRTCVTLFFLHVQLPSLPCIQPAVFPF